MIYNEVRHNKYLKGERKEAKEPKYKDSVNVS